MFPAVFALLMLVGPFMNKGSDRADSASASFSLPPDHLPPLFICSFVFLYFFVLLILYCCISVLFRLCIFSCPGISASSNVLWTKAATTALRHLHIEISCPSMFVLSDFCIFCIVEFLFVVFCIVIFTSRSAATSSIFVLLGATVEVMANTNASHVIISTESCASEVELNKAGLQRKKCHDLWMNNPLILILEANLSPKIQIQVK